MVLGKIKTSTKKAFTLIELLVVITIIGILATGATSVYTSQIQKARDTTRINDVEALRSGVEQFYQDKGEYPSTDTASTYGNYFSAITLYTPKLPKDPKSGQLCNKGANTSATACDYMYAVAPDNNQILFGEYKISTRFENNGNVTAKAETDGGNAGEKNRYEVGLDLRDAKSTLCDRAGIQKPSAGISPITAANCKSAIANVNGDGTLMIAGNP